MATALLVNNQTGEKTHFELVGRTWDFVMRLVPYVKLKEAKAKEAPKPLCPLQGPAQRP